MKPQLVVIPATTSSTTSDEMRKQGKEDQKRGDGVADMTLSRGTKLASKEQVVSS